MLPIKPLFDSVDSIDFARIGEVLCSTPGYNQSEEPNMLGATNDAQAIKTFLMDYKSAKLTYRSYLKEIERLVLWAIHIPKISISDLKRNHLIEYRAFLEDPQPFELWCGPRKPRLSSNGLTNPQWRPFASPLSKPTIRKTISILDSFFNYLVQNNYFAGNPLAVDKRRKGKKSNSTDRWLERDEILITLKALEENKSKDNQFEIIRAKFIILTLFYTGLRLAELTHHKMGDFSLIEGEWYLKVIGKGEKARKIVVVDEYLDALINFRKFLELPALPDFEEQTPLISAKDLKTPLTDSRVWQILKWAFNLGAQHYECMVADSEEKKLINIHKASKLRKASTHWLRHSYGTYLVKSGCEIEKVKELMGHSDISTTMIYIHIAKRDLHSSARNLSIRLDDDN